MDLLYYPGCTMKTSAKNLESSAIAVLRALGHELREMDEWNCCGVASSLTNDDLMHHVAPLRNLVHVEDQGFDRVIVICDMCANTLKQTDLRVKGNKADLDTLNAFMDRENDYRGTVKVQHLLEFLRDDVGLAAIRKKVKRPLKGLRIMPYYGCMLLRPREAAIDDAEEPRLLADLIVALGAEAVDNPYKVECCGSYRTILQKESTSRRAIKIAGYALGRGVDAIMLSCPLCRFNLDVRGKEAERLVDGYSQVPVLYYTQLMAVALGLGTGSCVFEGHAVDPTPMLRGKGVIP